MSPASSPEPQTSFAIIGTGHMATVMAGELATSPFARLTAVVSRSPERARSFAEENGIRSTATMEELADVAAEVVYVATPHHNHAAVAAAALEAGKHVLLEKAFTMNAAEAERITELAAQHDRFLMEAMWMRFNPAIRRMQALIADGAIGEPRSLYASFGRAVPFDPGHRLWDPERGGGSVLDQAVYPLTLADLVLGEPRSLTAVGSSLGYHGEDAGVDTEASVLLGYGDGRQAITSSSIRTALPRRASIGGAEGLIEIDAPFWSSDGFALQRPGVEPERFEFEIEGKGYIPMLRAVHEAVSEGRREHPLCPPATSVRIMRVLDEVRRQIGEPLQ